MGKKSKARKRDHHRSVYAEAGTKRRKSIKEEGRDGRATANFGAGTTKTNPLLRKLNGFLERLPRNEKYSFFSEKHVTPERRGELWMDQADLGEELVNRYSWAIPNERALRILKHFSPIVEIGCGANAYWCKLMDQAGVDIVGYDFSPETGGIIASDKKKRPKKREEDSKQRNGFRVLRGGPEVLAEKDNIGRTLFLCYPDENDDVVTKGTDGVQETRPLGAACLEFFAGEYIIHVGEIYGSTLSIDQAPWGRSSSPEFQQHLASKFHCVMVLSLPNWLHVRDTLTVWKRSETCKIVFAADDDDDGSGNDQGEEVEYRHIPVEERLPTDCAAPCLQHLLESCTEEKGDGIVSAGALNRKQQSRETTAEKDEIGSASGKLPEEQCESPEYDCPW